MMEPTAEDTITLLNEIADAEEGLAVRAARNIGEQAADVVAGSRRIAALCRGRARKMMTLDPVEPAQGHA